MGKITVNHYLNTNLKPYLIGNEKYYKVYFLLRYQSKNTKIKSLVNIEVTENEYNEILNDNTNLTNIRLKNEVVFVENIIKAIEKSNNIFDFKVFNDYWNLATYPIIERFQEYIKWKFERKFNMDLDFYQQLNVETYENILKEMKLFATENKKLIYDEILFGQLYDKEIRKEIDCHLKKMKKIKIWEIKKQDRENIKVGDIIRIEYEQVEYNTIDFLIDNLIKDGGFNLDYQKYTTGNTGDSIKYFNNLISSISTI